VHLRLLVALLSVARGVRGADHYVSPAGTTDTGAGTGTITNPWALATALAQPAAVHAGDTIWLRGGTYGGTHTSYVTGTSAAPIVVRQYPGERAILDGGNSGGNAILSVTGAYTWYWGFEIESSDPVRVASTDGDNPPEIVRGEGVAVVQSSATGSSLKFINLVIHDARQGIAFWKEAVDAEVYGCLIYYNGWDSPSRGNGHGVYTQNQTGTKKITDNIIFSGYGYGIHAYGSSAAFLDNLLIQGNALFNSGNLSSTGPSRVLLVGGGSVAHKPQVLDNFLYREGDGLVSDFAMGYRSGCISPMVVRNYTATTTYFFKCTSGLTMTDNTFYGATNFSQSAFPNNTYFSSRPTGVQVFVRPNVYEAGRGHIAVFNWDLKSTVNADVSSILTVGAPYEVRNAQDFFAPPVLSGVYTGGTLTLPMTGLTVAAPIGGATAPPATGPEFNTFVVLSKPDTSGKRKAPIQPFNGPPPIRRTPGPH
jgi:hypothetical protein